MVRNCDLSQTAKADQYNHKKRRYTLVWLHGNITMLLYYRFYTKSRSLCFCHFIACWVQHKCNTCIIKRVIDVAMQPYKQWIVLCQRTNQYINTRIQTTNSFWVFICVCIYVVKCSDVYLQKVHNNYFNNTAFLLNFFFTIIMCKKIYINIYSFISLHTVPH